MCLASKSKFALCFAQKSVPSITGTSACSRTCHSCLNTLLWPPSVNSSVAAPFDLRLCEEADCISLALPGFAVSTTSTDSRCCGHSDGPAPESAMALISLPVPEPPTNCSMILTAWNCCCLQRSVPSAAATVSCTLLVRVAASSTSAFSTLPSAALTAAASRRCFITTARSFTCSPACGCSRGLPSACSAMAALASLHDCTSPGASGATASSMVMPYSLAVSSAKL